MASSDTRAAKRIYEKFLAKTNEHHRCPLCKNDFGGDVDGVAGLIDRVPRVAGCRCVPLLAPAFPPTKAARQVDPATPLVRRTLQPSWQLTAIIEKMESRAKPEKIQSLNDRIARMTEVRF